LNGVMAVTFRYFTEFGKPAFQHNHADMWRNLCTSLLYFVVRIRCRHKGSSRSLSRSPDEFLIKIIWRLIVNNFCNPTDI